MFPHPSRLLGTFVIRYKVHRKVHQVLFWGLPKANLQLLSEVPRTSSPLEQSYMQYFHTPEHFTFLRETFLKQETEHDKQMLAWGPDSESSIRVPSLMQTELVQNCCHSKRVQKNISMTKKIASPTSIVSLTLPTAHSSIANPSFHFCVFLVFLFFFSFFLKANTIYHLLHFHW